VVLHCVRAKTSLVDNRLFKKKKKKKKEEWYSESVTAMKALPFPILSFCTYQWQIIKPG
jgi:hypothetical protein